MSEAVRSRSRSPVRRGGDTGIKRGGGADKLTRRVLVSNLPYDVKWQELKDYFRQKVGEVSFVEMFEEGGKPSGRGVVEFRAQDMVSKAIKELNKTEYKGRNMIIKEFFGGDIHLRVDSFRDDRRGPMVGPGGDGGNLYGDTFGLSPQFLQSLGILGPLAIKVFVANLDYKVTEKKVEEVFSLAGRVTKCSLKLDEEGKSKGQAVVEFEHPVEAVQAISMFNSQMLFDRMMTVRMDKFSSRDEPTPLPAGLKNIGMGLGEGGQALLNVAKLASSVACVPQGLGHNVGNLGLGGMGNDLNMGGLGQNMGGLGSLVTGMGSTGNLGMIGGSSLNPIGSGIGGGNLTGMPPPLSGVGSGYSSGRLADYGGSGNELASTINNRDSSVVVVRNLPQRYTWQSLKDKCQEIGEVKFAEINRGIGAVRFSTPEDAKRAMYKLDGIILDGSRIEVYMG